MSENRKCLGCDGHGRCGKMTIDGWDDDICENCKGSGVKTNSWYSNGGALVTDKEVTNITNQLNSDSSIEYYGKPHMIAESMSESAAKAISDALGLNYCGVLK